MATSATSALAIPRYVVVTKWIWLVGVTLSLIGAIVAVALVPHPLNWAYFGLAVAQAALAVPAALVLTRRKRWARMALMVMAVLSIGSLYQAFKLQNWIAVLLNLALASTLALLQDQTVREFFGLPARRERGSAG